MQKGFSGDISVLKGLSVCILDALIYVLIKAGVPHPNFRKNLALSPKCLPFTLTQPKMSAVMHGGYKAATHSLLNQTEAMEFSKVKSNTVIMSVSISFVLCRQKSLMGPDSPS